jgi:hypothetical protein
MTESILAKTFKFKVLRPQCQSLIENQRRKYFALRDKTEVEKKKLEEMVIEYSHLLAEEARDNRKV